MNCPLMGGARRTHLAVPTSTVDGWYLEQPRTVCTFVLEDWDRLDLWPEASRPDALLMVQDILGAAIRREISSLDQICDSDARAVVADVAGVAKLGATLTGRA